MTLELVKPSLEYLPGCKDALERGWSPDNLNTEKRRLIELAQIAADPGAFLHSLNTNREGDLVTLLDGITVRRLPGCVRWIWDGEFCGSINFRWQADGTPNLPSTCLGHIGYGVVPWKRNKGYATEALRLMLDEARLRLRYIEITTQPTNIASQKVILANGGELIEEFTTPPSLGGNVEWRYRIDLTR